GILFFDHGSIPYGRAQASRRSFIHLASWRRSHCRSRKIRLPWRCFSKVCSFAARPQHYRLSSAERWTFKRWPVWERHTSRKQRELGPLHSFQTRIRALTVRPLPFFLLFGRWVALGDR